MADNLYRKVRVFCWVMTSRDNVEKATVVRDTWAKRCNGYVFMSDAENADLPAVKLQVDVGT